MAPPPRAGRPQNGHGRRPRGQDRSEPCRLFLQGRCRYGEQCRYSHDGDSPPVESKEIGTLTAEDAAEKEGYGEWKRSLKRLPSTPSIHQMKAMMDDALQILAHNNQSLHQQIPRDLVDQDNTDGLQWIRQIMNLRISDRCYVGDLYVFISGSRGSRAIPFFQHVCQALDDSATRGKDADQTILCLVKAIREVITRNQKALYHEGLPGLIDSVSQLWDEAMVDKPLMAPTKIQIKELQRLRKRADTMLANN
ncbi:hypothetical protein ASPCAL00575 [Aspergillus calidoustus]|uniref:C3H1-type domain-containing protein n=1 Tax=Aspergillus calidoustus TaxID=454130 RepID=A0A0U5FQQ0_ASPCI|nr:hypothetical protein ASPCAL00575 [Aspergillus calidoustus]